MLDLGRRPRGASEVPAKCQVVGGLIRGTGSAPRGWYVPELGGIPVQCLTLLTDLVTCSPRDQIVPQH